MARVSIFYFLPCRTTLLSMKKIIQYKDPILEFLPAGVKPVMQIIVCPACGGRGQHSPQHLDESKLVDNMREDGDDEAVSHYFKGGFDVPCQTCFGNNVVESVSQQWVEQNHPEALRELQSYYREEARDRAYAAAERRAMGCY